jgi:hypothetical protein
MIFRKQRCECNEAHMKPAAEKYLSPKELADALCADHGLCLSVEYIQAIRRHSLKAGDKLFVLGMARTSELYRWLVEHPTFSRRAA